MYTTFHRRNHVRDHWFDPREGLWCVFTVKNVPLRNCLTYMDVSACTFSHERTCLYTTCPTISYVWARPTCFPRSVSNTRRVHARVHTLKDRCLLTFWVTKSFLCGTLNIWHLVCNIIFHTCTRNKVPHHDFLTYEPSHYATFDLQGRLRVQIFTYEDVSVCNVSQNF